MDDLTRKYTNDTLEEEYREMLCDQKKIIATLESQVRQLIMDNKMLLDTIKEEAKVNHNLLLRISNLTKQSP
jgi:hypothetical protein